MPVTDLSRIFKAYDVRGIYGDDIDGDIAEAVGRGLARALSDLSGKPVGELRIGLGRDMRLSAPELALRYRDGMVAEGAHVLQEIRAHIENGLGDAPGGGSFEEVDIYEEFQREALKVIDPSAIKPL